MIGNTESSRLATLGQAGVKKAFQNGSQMGQADQGTAEMKEGLMDVRPALVADRQAAIFAQPRQRALHDPAMPSQPCAALHALARDAHLDAALTQGEPTAREVVGLVRMHLVRALAGPAPPP